MALVQTQPLESDKGFRGAFSSHVSKHVGNVCGVCGLEAMGHGPESQYLGHDPHNFTPVPATAEMLELAGKLTSKAYRNRCKMELCGAYCVSTHR